MSTRPVLASKGGNVSDMLTKVLRGGNASSVQPVLWQRQGGPIAGSSSVQPVRTEAHQAWIPPKPPIQDSPENESGPWMQARIAEIERAAEQRVREARELAYREGEAAGRNQAAAQIQPVLDQLARSLHDIAGLRSKLRAEAESDLLRLALAIARKVLHRELSTDPEALSGLVKVAIEKIRLRDIVRVRIHPQYHAPVKHLLEKLSSGASIELLPDPKLELGGLVVETVRGEWNGSVETQLKEIERGLTDRLLR